MSIETQPTRFSCRQIFHILHFNGSCASNDRLHGDGVKRLERPLTRQGQGTVKRKMMEEILPRALNSPRALVTVSL